MSSETLDIETRPRYPKSCYNRRMREFLAILIGGNIMKSIIIKASAVTAILLASAGAYAATTMDCCASLECCMKMLSCCF